MFALLSGCAGRSQVQQEEEIDVAVHAALEAERQQRSQAQHEAEIEVAVHAALEAERQKLEKETVAKQRATSHDKFADFERKNRIVDWPKPEEFQANPFVYEGHNIGIVTTFRTMTTPTQGIFGEDVDGMMLVSDIPQGLFVKASTVVLVGSVVGKEFTEILTAGVVSVPHLKFVDAHICKTKTCDVLFFWQQHKEQGPGKLADAAHGSKAEQ
jgi:hypothetical protein